MRVDLRKANVTMPDGTLHSEARFVFLRGVVAVWHVDLLNWSGRRVFRDSDARFVKRRSARVPHEVVLSSGDTILVQPLYAGGSCCTPHPLKGYSSEQLISDTFTTTPISAPA